MGIVENSWLIAANCQILQEGWPKDVDFKVQFGCLQEFGRSQAFEVGYKKLLACRV